MTVAVGVPMYCREQALERLLESVPPIVATVYVADNGADQDRALYDRDWPFTLHVICLPEDCGIGRCRAAITDRLTESFLWMGDSDMEFLRGGDLRLLRDLLIEYDDLGGVAGWLLEGDTVRSGARDLHVHGETIVKAGSQPDVRAGPPAPHARFDFIPQAALFRREVFETYDYDPDARASEHVDFFLGQQQAGRWEFASTPSVVIRHNKQIDTAYRAEVRSSEGINQGFMADKWGVSSTAAGSVSDWAQLRERTLTEQAFDVFRSATPPRVWLPTKRVLERVVR